MSVHNRNIIYAVLCHRHKRGERMTKDILISISGLQVSPENESDTVEVISPGEYYYRNDKHFVVYEEVSVNDKDYLLVHAGLGNYSPEKEIEDYSLHELLWMRADYDVQYFENTYVITGHTPTQTIEGNSHSGYIYQQNNHIAIDCGAHYPGGRLAANYAN